MNINLLIHFFLCARDCTHLWHWQTQSYAEHKALGKFYDEWLELADKFVEVYAGRYGRPDALPLISVDPYNPDATIPYFRYLQEQLKAGDVRNAVDDTDLHNIMDEMLSLVSQTLYLLSLK
jgi:hypothetical protein